MTVKQENRYRELLRKQCDLMASQNILPHPHAYTPDPQQPQKALSKAYVRRWMLSDVEWHLDEVGEVNCTSLVEGFVASHPEHRYLEQWLDEETHWVWDLAANVANKVERGV